MPRWARQLERSPPRYIYTPYGTNSTRPPQSVIHFHLGPNRRHREYTMRGKFGCESVPPPQPPSPSKHHHEICGKIENSGVGFEFFSLRPRRLEGFVLRKVTRRARPTAWEES